MTLLCSHSTSCRYMYVCMYEYIDVCMYVQVCVCVYVRIGVCISVYVYVFMHVYIYICIYICLNVCMGSHDHVHEVGIFTKWCATLLSWSACSVFCRQCRPGNRHPWAQLEPAGTGNRAACGSHVGF